MPAGLGAASEKHLCVESIIVTLSNWLPGEALLHPVFLLPRSALEKGHHSKFRSPRLYNSGQTLIPSCRRALLVIWCFSVRRA